MSVWAALLAAAPDLPRLRRDGTNPHFRSKYVSLDALVDAVRPVLTRHGLVVVQPLATVDGHTVVTTIVKHVETLSEVSSSLLLQLAPDATPQQVGSAISYARRYSLMSLLSLSAGDDDDGHEASEPRGRARTPVARDVGTPAPATRSPAEGRIEPPADSPSASGLRIHFGKNSGVLVSSLPDRSLRWYATEWAGDASERDEHLKQAFYDELERRSGTPVAVAVAADELPF